MDSLTERVPDQELMTGGFPDVVDNWDEYFLWIAEAVAIKSKDPRCRVGAVIASKENLVIATGFNGLARRIHDSETLLADAEEKLKIICHAEANAIFNAARFGIPLQGSSIFVTKFPCLSCCNAIVQAGVGRIYTHDHRYWDDDPLDPGHKHKRLVLRQSRIKVDAPFHPEFMPRKVMRKPPRKGPSRNADSPLSCNAETLEKAN